MPLFKVCSLDRSKKVMVKAATLPELIDSAKVKLKIADDAYKVALLEDGTEVDDDEILLELANCSQAATNLILLPEDASWTASVENSTVSNTGTQNNSASIPKASQDANSSHEKFGANIWVKFPTRLTDCCEKGIKAWDVDRRTLVASIADYMVHDLKDSSRSTAERIAKIITDKYPKTFCDMINDDVVGSGIDLLRQQIYNAVNYRKFDKEKKRVAEMRLSDDEDDVPAPRPSTTRMQDEYGCVEYQPLLPADESETSQTEKKSQLKEYFSSREKDGAKISQLMDATYPTQRCDINKRSRDFNELFIEWPYLTDPQCLIDHASRLLGKSVQTVWEQSLTANAEPLRKYISYTEKSKMVKQKKSKSSVGSESEKNNNEILEMISEAKASSTSSKSEVALLALTFPLILNHMQEDSQFFFKVIPEDVEGPAIPEYAKQNNPILIVRGKSLFDENAKSDVVLDEKFVVSARGVLDGFLITFLSYYVFAYQYPPELSKSLEFIQRVLVQINPPTGHKRKDTKKRKVMGFDSAVMKLSNSLALFKDA